MKAAPGRLLAGDLLGVEALLGFLPLHKMMIRQRRFRLGQRVNLHDISKTVGSPHPLPPGWSDGTAFIVNIDSGWDEWVDGKWRERKEPAQSAKIG